MKRSDDQQGTHSMPLVQTPTVLHIAHLHNHSMLRSGNEYVCNLIHWICNQWPGSVAALACVGIMLATSDPSCQLMGVSCVFGNTVSDKLSFKAVQFLYA
jgi:hypothetical protein